MLTYLLCDFKYLHLNLNTINIITLIYQFQAREVIENSKKNTQINLPSDVSTSETYETYVLDSNLFNHYYYDLLFLLL